VSKQQPSPRPSRIDISGQANPLAQNPFGALDAGAFGAAASSPNVAPSSTAGGGGNPNTTSKRKEPNRDRGRVDIKRETGGRGGKTVTTVSGFIGIGLPEKETLAKKMRAACGCGGTVKDGRIEIQGDQRETVARILSEAGFRPVFAGG
jgi:translation initiation factor 1